MSPTAFSLKGLGLKFDNGASIAPQLAKLKEIKDTVEDVDLSGNTYGIVACEDIGKALSECKNLKKAQFDDIFTSRLITEIPSALSSLCDSLLPLSYLTSVNLSDNAFGGRVASPMVPFLSSHLPLEELILSNNGLGPEGGAVVADALTELGRKSARNGGSRLRRLVCGRNRLGIELKEKGLVEGSSEKWAEVYKVHPNLKEVRMYQDDIRMPGIIMILKGLKNCHKLELIDFEDNTFSAYGPPKSIKGVKTVAAYLKHWPNLKELCLSQCLLTTPGGLVLTAALLEGKNLQLTSLKLQGNELSESVASKLVQYLKNPVGSKVMKVEFNDNRCRDMEDVENGVGVWGELKEVMEDRDGELDELEEMEEFDEEAEEEEELADDDVSEEEEEAKEVKTTQSDKEVDELAELVGKIGITGL
ncbi:RNI-like protein [Atractiella rhizophila]|nr:RNI-like protein [Atractiella rhizophila]